MIHGSIVALVTPFREDRVDDAALAKLVEFHIANGTAAVIPCGTTGESPTFTLEEQEAAFTATVQAAAGRIPVIAGGGANSTKESVWLAQAAERAGCDAVMSVTPYYNKPTQEGLFQHWKAEREATSLPILLYNVPGRTGVNLLPETAARVNALGGILGVKEASGNLSQMQDLIDLGVTLYCGDDGLVLPAMAIGAVGVVSVVANFAPRLLADLSAACLGGDLATARRLHSQLHDLTKLAFIESNPLPAKAACAALGLCDEVFRLPLTPMSANNRSILLAGLRRHGILTS